MELHRLSWPKKQGGRSSRAGSERRQGWRRKGGGEERGSQGLVWLRSLAEPVLFHIKYLFYCRYVSRSTGTGVISFAMLELGISTTSHDLEFNSTTRANFKLSHLEGTRRMTRNLPSYQPHHSPTFFLVSI